MADGGFYIRGYSHRIDTIDCDDSIVGLFIPMTNTEINEQVALKMGWVRKSDRVWEREAGVLRNPSELPDYAHSIEAAWEIVEWLHDNGGKMLWKPYFELGGSGNGWLCRMRMNPHEAADTPSMAICLAFLKLEDK